mmetsp:Transcript_14543/g.20743  ORF Transcript_14543/g.20743 Transcript_14543/m.20743 type:complete len:238 (+) Transcript_14543:147-860(+)
MLGSTKELNRLINSLEWTSAIDYIKNHRGLARVWRPSHLFIDGNQASPVLPIHRAVALDCPIEVFDVLLKIYPSGLQQSELGFKRNILHIACINECSLELKEYIIKHYPDAVISKDKYGRLPLHYICINAGQEEDIDLILKSCKSSVECPDYNGCLPLHIACAKGAPPSIVKKLLDAFPCSSILRTNNGDSALDFCNASRKDVNTQRNKMIILKSINGSKSRISRLKRFPTSIGILV